MGGGDQSLLVYGKVGDARAQKPPDQEMKLTLIIGNLEIFLLSGVE